MNGSITDQDDINILRMHSCYDELAISPIGYLYDFTDSRLQLLRTKCNLDRIAGQGSQFAKMLKIVFSVSKMLQLGYSNYAEPFDALKLLELQDKGVKSNCYMAAVFLTECFLSMGYFAKTVRCLPLDLRFNECHCLTVAYVSEFGKFVAFDAGMGGCYVSLDGAPLSVSEMRNLIIEQKMFKLRSIYRLNNDRIVSYLSKNMVRFQTLQISKFGTANKQEFETRVFLHPTNLPMNNKHSYIDSRIVKHMYVYNEKMFWNMRN